MFSPKSEYTKASLEPQYSSREFSKSFIGKSNGSATGAHELRIPSKKKTEQEKNESEILMGRTSSTMNIRGIARSSSASYRLLACC